MNRKFLVILFIGASFCSSGQGSYADSTFLQSIQKARLYADSLRQAQNVPALSIAVGVRGRLVWSEAFGYADVEKKELATTETKFRVGSISKSMTAFGLAKLHDESKLNFDDTVGNYIPRFRHKKYPVTLRQLAGHQGGVRHYKGFEFLMDKQFESVEASLDVFIDDPLLFEPGTQYQYSSYGYVALSRVIEIVSGRSYFEFMQKEIFDPLGMHHTVAEDAHLDESNKAIFYAKGGKRLAAKVNVSSKWAGGGFLSTPEDMVNMVNRASKIISAQTLFTLVTPQMLRDGTPTDYGIGWRNTVVKSNNRVLVHHGGSSAGARAFLMVLLNEQVVVAVCTNSEADYNAKEVHDIAKYFLK